MIWRGQLHLEHDEQLTAEEVELLYPDVPLDAGGRYGGDYYINEMDILWCSYWVVDNGGPIYVWLGGRWRPTAGAWNGKGIQLSTIL